MRGTRRLSLALAISGLAGLGCAPALSDPGTFSPNDAGHAGSSGSGGGGSSEDALAVDHTAHLEDAGEAGPPGLDAADLVGMWEGLTSQGKVIDFVVDAAGVESWSFGWQLPLCGSTTESSFAVPVPIVGGMLSRSVSGSPSVVMTITFSSPTRATGSIDFTLKALPGMPLSCTGHDVATFEAAPRGG